MGKDLCVYVPFGADEIPTLLRALIAYAASGAADAVVASDALATVNDCANDAGVDKQGVMPP